MRDASNPSVSWLNPEPKSPDFPTRFPKGILFPLAQERSYQAPCSRKNAVQAIFLQILWFEGVNVFEQWVIFICFWDFCFFQVLSDKVSYSYLVNDYWALELKPKYAFVNYADPSLNIKWENLEEAEVSEADKNHPLLKDVNPLKPEDL